MENLLLPAGQAAAGYVMNRFFPSTDKKPDEGMRQKLIEEATKAAVTACASKLEQKGGEMASNLFGSPSQKEGGEQPKDFREDSKNVNAAKKHQHVPELEKGEDSKNVKAAKRYQHVTEHEKDNLLELEIRIAKLEARLSIEQENQKAKLIKKKCEIKLERERFAREQMSERMKLDYYSARISDKEHYLAAKEKELKEFREKIIKEQAAARSSVCVIV